MRRLSYVVLGLILIGSAEADNIYKGQVFRERIALPTSEFFISSATPEFTVTTLMNGVVVSEASASQLMFTLEGNYTFGVLVHYREYTPMQEGLLEFSFKGLDPDSGNILEWTDKYTVVDQNNTVVGGWIASASTNLNELRVALPAIVQNASPPLVGGWVASVSSKVLINEASLNTIDNNLDTALTNISDVLTGTGTTLLIHGVGLGGGSGSTRPQ